MPHYRETLVPQTTKQLLSAGDFCGRSLGVGFDWLHRDVHQSQAWTRQAFERRMGEIYDASIADQSFSRAPVRHSHHNRFTAGGAGRGDQQLGPQGIKPGSRRQSIRIERFAIRHGTAPMVFAVPRRHA
jgi:hypothetical protein